ncbi:MAG: 3-oxoacyl-[acyl-carrier protein] reductase [Arcticibacterium sp.]|jgi:3-oxoacyl-[acyl-carrier protein] reductase
MKKVALITGSATGVGAATAIQLAKKGWNVVINYSKSKEEADWTVALCKSAGAEVLLIKANVADDAACRELVKQTVDKWGRLDALVNNAGKTKFCNYNNLDGLNKEDFLDIYEVNVIGAYQMTRAAAPYLKQAEDGVIVNTSSVSAITGIGSSIAYAASKGALSTMTKSLSHALAPEIRVNGVCPGFIQGRWTKDFLGEAYAATLAQIEKGTLLAKTALPEDIAATIIYFIDHARLITGELLTVDGGTRKLTF